MKRIVILLVFIGFAKTNVAQLYQPFPTDSAVWREWAYEAQTSYVDNWDYKYFTSGDTNISGYNFHKIFKTGTYMRFGGPPAGSYNYINQYEGGYREDSGKQVLFCPSGFLTEQLLYDFNISIGDSLSSGYNLMAGEVAWVSGIDSILVGGQYHKQNHISGDTASVGGLDFVQLIEGVGSTFGLLGHLRPVFESESHLSCYTYNGTTEYPDSLTVSCADPIMIGVSEIESDTQISIFPNPTSGIITIKTPFSEKTTIEIFDVLGKKIVQTTFSSAENSLNLTQFPKGVYFLKATSRNKISSTQKIVLQ